jgi:DNA-binding transcriptional MocR family regulator
LAVFLRSSGLYPQVISGNNICISFGNSHGIATAITTVSSPGDLVIVEDPTYFLIGTILRDAGLRVMTCPVHPRSGMDMAAFESLVTKEKPRLVYVNPIHQNPSGSIMPLASREHLISLSAKHDFTILSDEPYVLLGFSDAIDETFSSLSLTASRITPASFRNLLCFGSFSKILTPGLRCGWISGHEDIIAKIASNGALTSGGGPASFISETIHQIVSSGELDDHIRFLRKELHARMVRLCETVTREFGPLVSFNKPQGGYFVFLTATAEAFDAIQFSKYIEAKGAGIKILASNQCSVLGPSHAGMKNGIRLAFSFYTPDEIEEGVCELARNFKSFIIS